MRKKDKPLHVPPVLRHCQFVGFEHINGTTQIVFLSNDPIIEGGVVRVKVSFEGAPLFIYSMYDGDSETILHFHGPHGDPSKDEIDEVKGTA